MDWFCSVMAGITISLIALMVISGFIAVATVSPIAVSIILGAIILGAVGGWLYHWKYEA